MEKQDVKIVNIDDPKGIIDEFNKWTVYFGGFNKNRENIYTDKPNSTSIGYRLIHENLPRFLDNIEKYNKAKKLGVDFSEVEQNYEVGLDDIFTLRHFNDCLTQSGIDRYNQIRGGQGKEGNQKDQGVNEKINLYAQKLESHKAKSDDDEKREINRKLKAVRSCKFQELFKQILSDRNNLSFRLDNIESDADLCKEIKQLFEVDKNDHLFSGEQVDIETGEIYGPLNITVKVNETLNYLDDANPNKLYVKNDRTLTDISQHLFGNWNIINKALERFAENLYPNNTNTNQKKRVKWVKNTSYFTFHEIHTSLKLYFESFSDEELKAENHQLTPDSKGITFEMKRKAENVPLINYFKNLKIKKKIEETSVFEEVDLFSQILKTYPSIKKILNDYIDVKGQKMKNEKGQVHTIKSYLDSLMDLYHFFKPLSVRLGKKDEDKSEVYEKDSGFYDDFDALFNVLEQIVPVYNKTRNYLTKKPYSVEKYKLNFNNPKLLGGFVDSHTDSSDNATQYGAYIFRKRYDQSQFSDDVYAYEYFLGFSKDTKLFRCHLQNNIEDKSEYERVDYYQPKSSTYFSDIYSENKRSLLCLIIKKINNHLDLARTVENTKELDELRGKLIKKDNPVSMLKALIEDKEFVNICEHHEDIKIILNDKEVINKCNETIREIQEHIIQYQKRNPTLTAIINSKYVGSQGLIDIVDHLLKAALNKAFNYFPVSQSEFENSMSNKEKPLFLFKISNKDLGYYDTVLEGKRTIKRGAKNLHTLYFEQLLSGSQNVIDIGTGEVFFRGQTENYKPIIHKAGTPIICKNYKENGKVKTVPENIYKELSRYFLGKHDTPLSHDANMLKNVVEKKTFKYDIIKNKRYVEDKYLFHLSIKLNYSNSNHKDFNNNVNKALRNNPEINILGIDRGERHLAYYSLINQQGDILDQGSLNNPQGKKDYHELLDKREKERDKARKSWGTVEKIKDLKAGYLSQVVYKIAKMAVENNAIIVFEDLNFGFKRGRFKVEKQVYQKLEKMLIDKLNYLVFKDVDARQPGGVLKALQLTAPFESFKKMGKQTGIIYYVPAHYTSKVCPTTGFVNLLYPRYETIKKSKEFFQKFDSIRFNTDEQYFEFTFNYKNFTNKAEGSQQGWTICSHGIRLENYRNSTNNNQWDTRIVNLTNELKELFMEYRIAYQDGGFIHQNIIEQVDSTFFKRLLRLLRLTLQLRNSRINSEEDWMISPIKDTNGEFFDSRQSVYSKTPENADANGAYHIALKGRWVLSQINQWKRGKLNLAITNKDWFKFIQEKPYKLF